MENIKLLAPAKLNLTLDVGGRRADGYHEIATTMHQISLTDLVGLRSASSGIALEHNAPGLSRGEDNLAYAAARAVMAYTGLKQGVRITLHKNIPMGAGLAGGSSDAAAVIQGMNGLFALQLSPAEMLRLGAELGSDVPFCISGGTAFCTGRGELVQSLPDPARELCFVLVTPDLMVSTAEVYAAFSPEKVKERPQEEEFQQAWRKGDMAGLFPAMKNVLESVSISKWPQIGALKQQMQALGARHTLMSGSGPTVFGIFPDALQAQQAANKLKTQYQTVSVCRSFCGLTSEV